MSKLIASLDALFADTDRLLIHEDEYHRVQHSLSWVFDNMSENVFLRSFPGRGRTTFLNSLKSSLLDPDSPFDPSSDHLISTSCEPETDGKDLLREILLACNRPAPRRQSGHYLRRRVTDALAEYDHVFFLIDDIHHVSDLESFLYLLTKTAPADREYSFGSVLTSRYSNIFDSVDQRILDHMGPGYLSLSSPSPEEVTRVLEDRIKEAFEPESITPVAKEFLATQAARDHGNLRTTLIWLAWAASVAEDADAPRITKTHIEQAIAKHERKLGVDHLHDFEFSSHQQAIFAILLEANHSGEDQLVATEIYSRYTDIVAEHDLESLSYGQFRENLKGMHHPWYVNVNKEPQDKAPAQWEATLECDPRMVATYLHECGIHTGNEDLAEEFDPHVLYRNGTSSPSPAP